MPVVDASAFAAWLLPDEDGAGLSGLLREPERCVLPVPLWAELRNIFVMAERRGRFGSRGCDAVLKAVDALDLEHDGTPDSATVIRLARTHRLTVYDALYLELAIRRGMHLVTRDEALARAATAEGVALD